MEDNSNSYKQSVKSSIVAPATKPGQNVAPQATSPQPDTDSKMSALKQYHRAMGLFYKCGAKWSKDHHCSPDMLHATQDL